RVSEPVMQGGCYGDVTGRSVKRDGEASLIRIDSGHEDNRNGRGRSFGRESRGYATWCRDDVHRRVCEIGSQYRQPTTVAVPPAVFDRHVATFGIAGFSEPFAESC